MKAKDAMVVYCALELSSFKLVPTHPTQICRRIISTVRLRVPIQMGIADDDLISKAELSLARKSSSATYQSLLPTGELSAQR